MTRPAGTQPQPSARGLHLFLAGLLLLAGAQFFLAVFAPALGTMRHGFPGYYLAARLVLEGRWSPAVYDDAWYIEQVLALTDQRFGEVYTPNAPTMSLVLLPFAGLDLAAARAAYLWFSLGLLGASLALLASALPALRRPPVAAAALIFVLQYAPLKEDLRVAQMYSFLLFFYSLALWSMGRRRPTSAGLALAVAAAAKLSGWPVWLTLAARRGWRVLAVAGAGVVVLALLTLPFAGWQGWAAFAAKLAGLTARPGYLAVTAYQSTPSFFQHMLVWDAKWNPSPLLHLPWMATALTALAILAALGLTLRRSQAAALPLAFAMGLALSVLLPPYGDEHAYVLMLLPLAVALSRLADGPTRPWAIAWLAVAALLIAGPWPFKHPWLSEGWRAFLAYPRLYGGWLLWAWLWREAALDRASTPDGKAH